MRHVPCGSAAFALLVVLPVTWSERLLDEALLAPLSPFDQAHGPRFGNISQGLLGNCYVLSSLGAVAHAAPDAIKSAFVDAGALSEDGLSWVYSIRFIVAGKERIVAVDDAVPMSTANVDNPFFFAAWNAGGAFWPVILEKAYAKLLGSYLRMSNGGIAHETFRAITGAPSKHMVAVWNRWLSEEALWSSLAEAAAHSRPVVAGANDDTTIVTRGHKFIVIGTGSTADHPRMVNVYNPWNTHRYSGVIKGQDANRGDFWMTFEEFRESFYMVTVSMWEPGYKLHSLTVPVGAARLSFHIDHESPFWVSVDWPMHHLFDPAGCSYDHENAMDFHLWVAKQDKLNDKFSTEMGLLHTHVSNQRVRMQGAGDYAVFMGSYVGNMSEVVESVTVGIYAPEHADPRLRLDDGDPMQLALHMSGLPSPADAPCKHLLYKGDRYTFHSQTFRGGPAWVSMGGEIMFLSRGRRLYHVEEVDASSAYGAEPTGVDAAELSCFDARLEKAAEKFMSCSAVSIKQHISLGLGNSLTMSPMKRSRPGSIPPFFGRAQSQIRKRRPSGEPKEYVMELTDAGWELFLLGTTPKKVRINLAKTAKCSRDASAPELDLTASPPPLPEGRQPPTSATCDVAAAREQLLRLDRLNKFDELREGKRDVEFPPELWSIGDPNECKRSAARGKRCEDYDSWEHFSQRIKRSGRPFGPP